MLRVFYEFFIPCSCRAFILITLTLPWQSHLCGSVLYIYISLQYFIVTDVLISLLLPIAFTPCSNIDADIFVTSLLLFWKLVSPVRCTKWRPHHRRMFTYSSQFSEQKKGPSHIRVVPSVWPEPPAACCSILVFTSCYSHFKFSYWFSINLNNDPSFSCQSAAHPPPPTPTLLVGFRQMGGGGGVLSFYEVREFRSFVQRLQSLIRGKSIVSTINDIISFCVFVCFYLCWLCSWLRGSRISA